MLGGPHGACPSAWRLPPPDCFWGLWYEAIPKDLQPPKNQPFYHLFAENTDSSYVAYVSQQNLVGDSENGPVGHPDIEELFEGIEGERYTLRREACN